MKKLQILEARMLEIVLSNQLHNYIRCKLYGAVNCALLGYYAASSGNFLPTFLGQPIGNFFPASGFMNPEAGKKLPLLAT